MRGSMVPVIALLFAAAFGLLLVGSLVTLHGQVTVPAGGETALFDKLPVFFMALLMGVFVLVAIGVIGAIFRR